MAGLQSEIVNERNVQPLRSVSETNVGSGGFFGFARRNVPTSLPQDFFSNWNAYSCTSRERIVADQVAPTPSARTSIVSWLADRAPSQTASFRQRELDWRRTHPEVLTRYQNEWVVLEGETIIAHGSNAAQVIRDAKSRGIQTPYIFFVERESDDSVRIGL